MTKTKKTAKSVVFAAIRRRKTPVTAAKLVASTGLPLYTVKSSLRSLTAEGQITVVGTQYTGARPANLYLAV